MRTTSHQCDDSVHRFDFGRCELSYDKPRDAVAFHHSVILAVHRGAVVVEDGSNVCRLVARSCALFTSGKSLDVAITDEAGAAVMWCKAPGQGAANPSAADRRRTESDRLVLSDQIDALMRLGIQVESNGTKFEEGLRDALGMAIFSTFRAQADALAPMRVPDCVRKVRDHIDRNCEEDVDLTALAAIAGVSREHLNVVFRRYVGLTPMRYLWNVRTQKAVGLVRGTDLTVASVAELCGFKSPFHLSREIKRSTGQSPRDLRRVEPS